MKGALVVADKAVARQTPLAPLVVVHDTVSSLTWGTRAVRTLESWQDSMNNGMTYLQDTITSVVRFNQRVSASVAGMNAAARNKQQEWHGMANGARSRMKTTTNAARGMVDELKATTATYRDNMETGAMTAMDTMNDLTDTAVNTMESARVVLGVISFLLLIIVLVMVAPPLWWLCTSMICCAARGVWGIVALGGFLGYWIMRWPLVYLMRGVMRCGVILRLVLSRTIAMLCCSPAKFMAQRGLVMPAWLTNAAPQDL